MKANLNFLFAITLSLAIVNLVSCGGGENPIPKEEKKAPTVTTYVGTVTESSLEIGGSVISDGNSALTEVFVEVTPLGGTTTKISFTPSGAKEYKINFNAISNTEYSVRFTARNAVGTATGNVLSEVTNIAMPIFGSISILDITKNSARVKFSVQIINGSYPSIVGLEYQLSDNGIVPVGEVIKTQSVAFTGTTPGNYNFEFLFTDGAPGQIYFVQAYATMPDTKLYGSEKFFQLNGYKYGMIIDGDIVVAVYNNGSDGKALHMQELKNTTVGSPYRPSWGWYAGYYAGTSTIAGSGPANTIAITSATPAQVYQGTIDPLGAAYLCRDLVNGSHSDYFLPSKGDWIEFASHYVEIFGNVNNLSLVLKSGNYYTSSENGTDYYYSVSTPQTFANNSIMFLTTVKMGSTDGFGKPSCMAMRNLPHCD